MTQRILVKNYDGTVAIVIPAPGFTVQDCIKDVPAGVPHEIVDTVAIPADRTFRNAWKHDPVKKVDVDMVKAKDITHARRRAKRDVEMAPHDEIIMKQIPGKSAVQAEAARAAIRAKYDTIQINVDACSTADELKAIIVAEGL